MNILSLFDGMSCGQLALDQLGIKVDNYFASEIDKHAMSVAKDNYPDTIHVGDVTKVSGDELPHIDMLIGGSPCTSFSFGGKGNGMSTKDKVEILTLDHYLELKEAGFEFDGQSYLFWEYVRLLRKTNPKYFLLENVNMSKKWKDILSGVLGVEPIAINSTLMSAQNRPRLYWTNIPGVTIPVDKNITIECIRSGDDIDYIAEFQNSTRKHVVSQIDDVRSANGNELLNGFHKLECTSGWADNKVAITKCPCLRANKTFVIQRTPSGGVREFNRVEWERLQTVPNGYTDIVSFAQAKKMLGNGWTVDVIKHIFSYLGDN